MSYLLFFYIFVSYSILLKNEMPDCNHFCLCFWDLSSLLLLPFFDPYLILLQPLLLFIFKVQEVKENCHVLGVKSKGNYYHFN